MKIVFPEKIYNERSIIFHTKNVLISKEEHKGLVKKIKSYPFSLNDILKKPFKSVIDYRNFFKEIKTFIISFFQNNSLDKNINIVLGTEKDNFTQVFISYIYKQKNIKKKLIAVEEGLGYYVDENFKDKLISFAYFLLTPILFNQPISYHKQLGRHKKINDVYLRLPELIKQSKRINYFKFDLANKSNSFPKGLKKGKVLIFSFPNADYGLNEERKLDVIKSIITKFENRHIIIKPHPREQTNVFKKLNGDIKVLIKGAIGEEINYFDYEFIVNFSSSIIIDILSTGYPSERIYTIGLKRINFSLLKKTNYVEANKLKQTNFEI